jgi:hypothetical protein
MPQLTSITVNDGLDTPVSHTFERGNFPVQGAVTVGTLYESDGTIIGDNKLSLKTVDRSKARLRPVLSLSVPVTVTETINGVSVESVVDTNHIRIEGNFGSSSTTDNRKVIRGLAANLLDDATVKALFEDLEGLW